MLRFLCSAFTLSLVLFLIPSPGNGRDTLDIRNDHDEAFTILIDPAGRGPTTRYHVGSGRSVTLKLGNDQHKIILLSKSGKVYEGQGRLKRFTKGKISLSTLITQKGRDVLGRRKYQWMKQNGFFPKRRSNSRHRE